MPLGRRECPKGAAGGAHGHPLSGTGAFGLPDKGVRAPLVRLGLVRCLGAACADDASAVNGLASGDDQTAWAGVLCVWTAWSQARGIQGRVGRSASGCGAGGALKAFLRE